MITTATRRVSQQTTRSEKEMRQSSTSVTPTPSVRELGPSTTFASAYTTRQWLHQQHSKGTAPSTLQLTGPSCRRMCPRGRGSEAHRRGSMILSDCTKERRVARREITGGHSNATGGSSTPDGSSCVGGASGARVPCGAETTACARRQADAGAECARGAGRHRRGACSAVRADGARRDVERPLASRVRS